MASPGHQAAELLEGLRAAVEGRRLRRLRRGEQLFRRGERVESLFLLDSGRMRLERTLEDGSSVTVHVARAPALLAEASLFAPAYHCDAVAEVGSVVEVLDREGVLEALARDRDLDRLLLRRLATEVRDLRSRLELRSVRPVERRVLLGLESEPWRDRSLSERAAELGLAPETLSRTLARLEEEGKIERNGRSVRVSRARGRRIEKP